MSIKGNQQGKPFKVTLLWQIASAKSGPTQHTAGEVLDLGKAMFPGINWWWSQTNQVALKIIAPAFCHQAFSNIAGCRSEEEAIKTYGETVLVTPVRPIEGYAWMEELKAA